MHRAAKPWGEGGVALGGEFVRLVVSVVLERADRFAGLIGHEVQPQDGGTNARVNLRLAHLLCNSGRRETADEAADGCRGPTEAPSFHTSVLACLPTPPRAPGRSPRASPSEGPVTEPLRISGALVPMPTGTRSPSR